ncbi:MAG TPA: SUMF1/EgtB/PvdO family nonheme iron enzyme [Polyangiaceae bacterium]|nr:SUMF1/EgtB/PvdO family nonheme iron enzyme [Polyangiaceae bacterium]
MHPRRRLAQRASRSGVARFGGFAGFALVVAATFASGCLVSFDGYEPLDAGGSDSVGDTSSGGDVTSGGKTNGGASNSGGKSQGGSSGGAGATDPLGGAGGDVGGTTTAGSTTGGSAGAAMGGKAGASGSGGATGGSAGSAGASGGVAGKGGSAGNAGTGGAGGGTAGAGGGGGKTCPVNLSGPPMIDIPKPGGGIYCMDRTEVTNEDYAAFLAANVAAPGPDSECAWNNSYAPDTSIACTAAQGAYDPVGKPRVPVSCVDWCDAKRYCDWAGKRLCGAIAGGSNPPTSYIDANTDQWYRACSKAGTLKFPYGNTYQPTYCVGLDNSGTHPSQVASAVACIGGYNGLYDLSGNVAEWEDSCSAAAGANDNCLTRGGSIQSVESVAPSLLCNDSTINDATPMPATAKRNSKDELVGLRCCYDP